MKKGERVGYVIAIILVFGLPLWLVISIMTTPEKEPSPFIGNIGESYLIDPSTRKVSFTVTNKGDQPERASCLVSVQNSEGSYKGLKIGSTDTLTPGEERSYSLDISISNEGAAYITEGSVYCDRK